MLHETERKSVLRMFDAGTKRGEIHFIVFMSRFPSLDLSWNPDNSRIDVVDQCYQRTKSDVDAFLGTYATDTAGT